MNNIKFHIIYLAIIAVLVTVVGISLNRPEKVIEVVNHTTDTLTLTKVDTLVFTKVVEREKRVVDTVYISSEEGIKVPIPISEYRFYTPNKYDIIAKGYDVSLSSIKVFPTTEYQTITNTIEKEVVLKKSALYLGVGIMAYNKEIIPEVGIYYTTKEKFLFGLKMGYSKGNTIWSGTIAYKLTK